MRAYSMGWMALLAMTALTAARARTVDQLVTADPAGKVTISNIAGEIDVIGWDRPQVSVKGDLASDDQRLEFTSQPGRTLVSVIRSGPGWGGNAHLTVQVPKGSELEISSISAAVDSKGVLGPQHIQTVSGSIAADLGTASCDVRTVSGDIRLRGDGQPTRLRVSSVSGSVEVEQTAGDIEATTVSGRLKVSPTLSHGVRLHATSGQIDFSGRLDRGATLESQSISGSITIHAPAQAGYEYEVQTFSGTIDNCFGEHAERASEYAPGSRLDGKRGPGDGHIRVRSLSGTVSLCDH
jgi:hypothetical protein